MLTIQQVNTVNLDLGPLHLRDAPEPVACSLATPIRCGLPHLLCDRDGVGPATAGVRARTHQCAQWIKLEHPVQKLYLPARNTPELVMYLALAELAVDCI